MVAKNPALFYGAIVIAVIAFAAAIYYLIPGIYHILADGPQAHYKHAMAFAAVAVICVIAALVNRPKAV